MGKTVTYTNNTKAVKHVGTKTIFPGGSREVDVDDLEGDERKKFLGNEPETKPKAPAFLALLENNIGNFTKLIAEQDEDGAYLVTVEQLDELNDAEQLAKHPRAGIAQAIASEKLRRADESFESDVEKFQATLQDMEISELHDQFETYKEDAGSLAIVENVWREKLTALDDDGRTSLMETMPEGSRQLEILNEVIGG